MIMIAAKKGGRTVVKHSKQPPKLLTATPLVVFDEWVCQGSNNPSHAIHSNLELGHICMTLRHYAHELTSERR